MHQYPNKRVLQIAKSKFKAFLITTKWIWTLKSISGVYKPEIVGRYCNTNNREPIKKQQELTHINKKQGIHMKTYKWKYEKESLASQIQVAPLIAQVGQKKSWEQKSESD